jgi:hypothetical protein
MPTLEEVLSSAIEIKDLPLRNELESTDCFEICTTNGASYRIELSQLSGEGVTPVEPFSQAISGTDGDIIINHNLNKVSSIVTIDNSGSYVSLVLTQLNLNSVQVQWNGLFTGNIYIN